MRRSFCSAVFCKAIWPPCLKGAGTPIGTKAYFILPLEGKWHGASRDERVFSPSFVFFAHWARFAGFAPRGGCPPGYLLSLLRLLRRHLLRGGKNFQLSIYIVL